MAHDVGVLAAAIAGIALHGVDHAIFHPFHDAYMVRHIVLRPGGAFVVPIKKYQVSGARLIAAVLPLSPILEPIRAACAARKLGDHSSVNVAALVGAPADKAGAPLHPAVEAVPAPVRQAPDPLRLWQRERHEHRPPPADGREGDGGPGNPADRPRAGLRHCGYGGLRPAEVRGVSGGQQEH